MKFQIKVTTLILLAAAFFISLMQASPASASATWLSSIQLKTPGIEMVAPTRLAIDKAGNLYVTESRNNKNRVLVFDRNGGHVRTLAGLKAPLGIAVDANDRIYVGNKGSGNVELYDQDFKLLRKLGSGDKEFQLPQSIAVTSSGLVFVVDTLAHLVKVFDENGSPVFSFNGGTGFSKFNNPYDIAIDEGRGEVYITDNGIVTIKDPSYGTQTLGGARVQVFTLNGAYIRGFGQFASYTDKNLVYAGQLRMPQGIASDGSGMLYVTDSNQAAVAVFAAATGAPIEYIDSVVDENGKAHTFSTPVGIVIGKDRRMFIASLNSGSVEVFGLDGYTSMSLSPKTLSFSSIEGGLDPAAQTISIMNSGSGSLDWTASTTTTDGAPWLQAGTAAGSAESSGSSTLAVGVKTTGLPAGNYTGTVMVKAAAAEEMVSVDLVVAAPPAKLSLSPSALAFEALFEGPPAAGQVVTISNAGTGALSWSAATTAPWLILNASTSFLTVGADPKFAATAGSYSDVITITAQGAQASPQNITVTMNVVSAGTIRVNSNIDSASFDISGPKAFSSSGKAWTSTAAVPGDYTITFNRVPGYLKPVSTTFTVATGKEAVISGNYRKKQIPTHILAGSAGNTAASISLIPLNPEAGAPAFFTPFAGAGSVKVAAGDLDGSGSDKIVTTDYKRSIRVFGFDKTLLASFDLSVDYNRADVAVGDIDNDGKADILVAAVNDAREVREIRAFSYLPGTPGELVEIASIFTESKSSKFSVALGDINDDGLLEVVIADATSVRAFAIEKTPKMTLAQLWSKSGDYGTGSQVTTGDLNGDGIAEIAVSYENAKKGRGRDKEQHASSITVINGTGEDRGLTIEPFKDLGYREPSNIVMGDLDGDNAEELAAGAGPAAGNDPLIRLFETDGSYAGTTMKPMDGQFGVNVGFGSFQ